MAPFFVLDDFVRYLQIEKRFSPHTVLAYQKDIEQFCSFAELANSNELKEINAGFIRSWVVHLIESSLTNRSVNRKISSLRAFFRWMKKEGKIVENPIKKLTAPKIHKRLPSFAKEADLDNVHLDLYFSNDFEGCRDRLMVEFFYQTGMRLSELVNLKNDDVRDDHLKVLGKRNKERIIPVSSELSKLINDYKKIKSKTIGSSMHFFVRSNGNQLYPKLVYRRINDYLSNVTNLDKCSPHVLRHTFATHMLNNGAGLETLKDLLGHANLSATQIYTHNSFAKLTNIYSHAHPRGHKNK